MRTLTIIDQRRLPGEVIEVELRTLDAVDEAIRTLAVRGAPAIGVAAALGLVAAFTREVTPSRDALLAAIDRLARSRPTAVNLPWAMARLRRVVEAGVLQCPALLDVLAAEAERILDEDVAMCAAIGAHGATLLADGARVLTHCNAGRWPRPALAPLSRRCTLPWPMDAGCR